MGFLDYVQYVGELRIIVIGRRALNPVIIQEEPEMLEQGTSIESEGYDNRLRQRGAIQTLTVEYVRKHQPPQL